MSLLCTLSASRRGRLVRKQQIARWQLSGAAPSKPFLLYRLTERYRTVCAAAHSGSLDSLDELVAADEGAEGDSFDMH